MTRQQAQEVAAWRSSPLTSKTMWTIYIGQGSLALGLWQYLAECARAGHAPSSVVVLGFVIAIALVAITGVAGLAWTDPAVAVVRALKASPEPQAHPPGLAPPQPGVRE